MYSEEVVFDAGDQKLAGTMIYADNGRRPSIAHLHGLGPTASRHQVRYLLDPLAEHGYGSLTFEYSGNGDSTGVMEESCIARRMAETLAAVSLLDPDEPPLLIGGSMGCHLAASLVPTIKPRGLVFFVPAAYPGGAEHLVFDENRARAGNYADSAAFAGMREFDGDLLIIAGKYDQIVPSDVVGGYLDSARNARSTEVIWLEGDHFVHRWLPGPDWATERAAVQEALLRFVSTDYARR
ncbi:MULTISPECIES: alpha/beta hydrolase [unclassified Nocardia]|uniref:alpha/beta hydrolase n=1 Tax=unclassified Nocardia TaxID=2637762 RepID=UPI001CE4ADDF|nr:MULTISPECIES: alpha/beta hydrolase [unclassified Nocardia]